MQLFSIANLKEQCLSAMSKQLQSALSLWVVLHGGRDVVRGTVMEWRSRDVADHMVGI